jgi:hypothetical protein
MQSTENGADADALPLEGMPLKTESVPVPDGEEYCGADCRDAGEDVKNACQCDHAACPITIRPFAAPSVDLRR